MKRERCGGTVAYQTLGGMRVFNAYICGPNMYNAKCTVCGHQWQDSGKSKVCRALVAPPVPAPTPPLPDAPYGLVYIERELYLTTQVDGCEVLIDDSRHLECLDASSLVVISRERLATLEKARTGAVYPPGRHPRLRGTVGYPCEDCHQEGEGATLLDGWYRCNACGYPGK